MNYGEVTDLFLLAKIHTATGIEASITNTGFKCVQKVDHCESIERLKQLDEVNKEGFVVKFMEDNLRIKIKFPSYITLHKQVINIPQNIDVLTSETISNIPDECFKDFTNQIEQLYIEDEDGA